MRRRARQGPAPGPFHEGTDSFLHGTTIGGHPVSCAAALVVDPDERDNLIHLPPAPAAGSDEPRQELGR